ncbi:hypothetical protein Dimus_023490 [Dionaea muscipula]
MDLIPWTSFNLSFEKWYLNVGFSTLQAWIDDGFHFPSISLGKMVNGFSYLFCLLNWYMRFVSSDHMINSLHMIPKKQFNGCFFLLLFCTTVFLIYIYIYLSIYTLLDIYISIFVYF